jgi:hypothetical protein
MDKLDAVPAAREGAAAVQRVVFFAGVALLMPDGGRRCFRFRRTQRIMNSWPKRRPLDNSNARRHFDRLGYSSSALEVAVG